MQFKNVNWKWSLRFIFESWQIDCFANYFGFGWLTDNSEDCEIKIWGWKSVGKVKKMERFPNKSGQTVF